MNEQNYIQSLKEELLKMNRVSKKNRNKIIKTVALFGLAYTLGHKKGIQMGTLAGRAEGYVKGLEDAAEAIVSYVKK